MWRKMKEICFSFFYPAVRAEVVSDCFPLLLGIGDRPDLGKELIALLIKPHDHLLSTKCIIFSFQPVGSYL